MFHWFPFLPLIMDCERKDSDEEDLELEELRLAALATLKSSRAANKLKTESSEASTINRASPVIPSALPPAPYIRKEQGPPNQYSWRNSALQSRRGRGWAGFPKINPRSNLIVITPVSTDDKDSTEKSSAPQLLLPQHKWCQAVNENSSSPKTYSRRGPTRFNRHESGSESDSDYDDASDRDSYSNETILQDENSVNFAQLTPEESIESESPLTTQRNADHRLSFQNANLDSIQPAQELHSSKSTYPLGLIADATVSSSTLNDSNYLSYQEYNPTPSTSYQSQIVPSVPVNGVLRIDQDYDSNRRRISDVTPDSFSGSGTKSCSVDPNLSQNDLRLELKKRMLKLRSETADLGKSETQSSDKHVRDEKRTNDDLRHEYARERSRIPNHSRSGIANDTRMRDRSRSLTRDRNRQRSSSPRNPDRERSHSRDRDRKRAERHPKRASSRSPEQLPSRRHNRGSIRSPNRNGKRSWSRSPVKVHRRTSVSPSRNNKRNYSRSPEWNNNRKYSRSPERSNKRNYSHSPDRNKRNYSRSPERNKRNYSRSPERSKKRNYSRSPERSNKRNYSRSPERNNKPNKSRSPERNNKHHYSRSPERNAKRNYSPDKKKLDYSHSPSRSTKRISTPSPVKDKSSHSPYKSRKRSSTRSPDRTSKHETGHHKSRRRSGTHSPVRKHKRNASQSPDKSRRNSPPKSPDWKHKLKVSRSPLQSQKHDLSQSPVKKLSRTKQDRSKSPVRNHRHDSSESPERSKNRSKKKKSRHRWSRSSSTLSSSSGSASSSNGFPPCVRSISSVIKPVQCSAPAVQSGVSSKDKHRSSPDSDFSSDLKKRKDLDEKPKALSSLVKSSIVVGENRNNAPDSVKRLPVHMRLGNLPRNKLIQMTKDVEAAFVNTSSDEDGDTEGKKQNYRIVAEMNANKGDVLKRHVEKSPLKNNSDSKSRKKKAYR